MTPPRTTEAYRLNSEINLGSLSASFSIIFLVSSLHSAESLATVTNEFGFSVPFISLSLVGR